MRRNLNKQMNLKKIGTLVRKCQVFITGIDSLKKYHVCLVAILIYRLYEFRYIPFGSPDDTFMAARAMAKEGNFYAAFDQAKSQGRFYQFFFMLFTMSVYEVIPHDQLWLVISLQIFLFAIALYFSISKLFRNRHLATLVTTLFLLFYDFRGSYNNLTSFPLWFCFSFSIFLLSIVCLSRTKDFDSGYAKAIRLLSYILSFISSLAYESYLIFPLLLLILDIRYSIMASCSNGITRQEMREAIRKTSPGIYLVLLFYFIYFSFYFGFRYLYPTEYPGTQISVISFIDPITTILRLSFSGFSSFYYSIFQFKFTNLLEFITNSPVAAAYSFLITAIVIQLIFITVRIRFERTSLIFLFALVLTPNFLLAITSRYQEISREAPLYLGALPSSVPLLILLVRLLQLGFLSTDRIRIFTFTVLAIFLFNSAMVNDQNIKTYTEIRRTQNVAWDYANSFIQDQKRETIQERTIFSPDLINLIQSHVSYGYWTEYFSKSLNERFILTDSLDLNLDLPYLEVDFVSLNQGSAFITKRINPKTEVTRVISITLFGISNLNIRSKLINLGFKAPASGNKNELQLRQISSTSDFSNPEKVFTKLKFLLPE